MEQQPSQHEEKIDFETFIRRSWPILALGAFLIVVAIVSLIWFAVSGKGRKDQGQANATSTTETATTTPMVGDQVPRGLDGVLVAPADANLQPFAVMVENTPDARPLSGPAKANLVFELPVEGGITRYMLVFDATTTVDQVGPVRSARPYYVDLAQGLDAVYAHVGGSPEALDKIKGLSDFRDLNEFSNAKYFWRSAKRVAPHNVYTRSDLLAQADAAKEWKLGKFTPWHYKEDDPLEPTPTTTARGDENGPTLPYGGSYTAKWKYDRESNLYSRYESGTEQKDADGTAAKAKNIVVVRTDSTVLDNVGRLRIRTTGKGPATLYRDGKKSEITWLRTAGQHLRFETLDGSSAYFDRGTTWVEFVTGDVAAQASSTAATTSTTR